MKQATINHNNIVLCDFCNGDFTNSDEKGGFLFSTYAVCPLCEVTAMDDISKNQEERFISDRAEEGESFKNFVTRIRT